MQALFVLAFAIGLLGISRRRSADDGLGPLVAVPLAILAAGSVYTYSFPGLTWLIGALGIWVIAELFLVMRDGGDAAAALRGAVRPTGLALVVLLVLVGPELGRMIDFSSFETFDPNGPGLGNLFGQVSPTEALGIWPSGDFRLSAGDGTVPALAFYAGVAFAALLLAWGLVWWLRRGMTAVPAALAAAGVAYLAARAGGTPYTAAKAIEMAAPLAMLTIVRPLLDLAPFDGIAATKRQKGGLGPEVWKPLAAAAFVIAAGGCSLLALANGPVGPTAYSPALTGLRPQIADASALILAPESLLRDQHGTPYLAWELRGGRVCIKAAGAPSDAPPLPGVEFVISEIAAGRTPPYGSLILERRAGPYLLWRREGPVRGTSPCPLIAVRSARQGEKQ
jgi:hypothetical protein